MLLTRRRKGKWRRAICDKCAAEVEVKKARFWDGLFRAARPQPYSIQLERAATNGDRDAVQRLLRHCCDEDIIRNAIRLANRGKWHAVSKDLQLALDGLLSDGSQPLAGQRAVPLPAKSSKETQHADSPAQRRVHACARKSNFLSVFLKGLFGGTASGSGDAKGNNWYLATAHNNRVRQIVFTLPPTCACESKFSRLTLFSPYRVTQKDWVTEVFTLDGDPGPYLIARADDVTSKLRGHTTRVAFGFNHMKASGVFSIHVNVDCPQATKREIGFSNIGFEVVIGLDTERAVELYGKFIRRATTHICFAERTENAGVEYINAADGTRMTAFPQGKFDLVSEVPPDCLFALEREWNALLSYHKTVSRPDFQAAVNDLWTLLPQFQERCPIIPPV
jgi:hypothetical protein